METLESWPERVLTMQRNWIGRSQGAEVVFRQAELGIEIPVFTTRPDTLFGATFFVLAPEHPLVEELVRGTEHEDEVLAYVRRTAGTSVADRMDAGKAKTGVFTGRHVINPVNDEAIEIWVADYVLVEYGTGAVMAVPAHDERDFAFAQTFGLPIRPVVAPRDGDHDLDAAAYTEHTADEVHGQLRPVQRAARRRGDGARSSTGWSSRVAASARPPTGCATGSSRGSATGACRSRSSTARRAASWPCRSPTCRCCCPR